MDRVARHSRLVFSPQCQAMVEAIGRMAYDPALAADVAERLPHRSQMKGSGLNSLENFGPSQVLRVTADFRHNVTLPSLRGLLEECGYVGNTPSARAQQNWQTPLTQRKEETTSVGTLHLLDNDASHGHLQSALQSNPHASHRSAHVQLSAHSDSSSTHLTPSPSSRATPIPLPSGPQTSPESIYDASISSTGVSGKGPGPYSGT
ncbi:hypothetical protein BU17DRAFT_100063 [Hysterangium stoloniferum]|nr:hypothetical protein BU17DRAFT_100063 [Hysterangium stoloniferum]